MSSLPTSVAHCSPPLLGTAHVVYKTAMQRWQEVRGLIQKARDQGMSHEELAQAFSRARQMLEQIEAVKR